MARLISKEAFLNRVRTEVFPLLAQTEARRKKMLLLWGAIPLTISLFLIYIVWSPMIYSLFEHGFNTQLLISVLMSCFYMIPIILLLFVPAYIGKTVLAFILAQQKEIFSPLILKFLGGMKYTQEIIPSQIASRSQLFPRFDMMETEDTLSGALRGTPFSVSEAFISLTGKKERHIRYLFRGILIDIPLRKKSKGHTLIFNKFFSEKRKGFKQVEIEYRQFMQKNHILSRDQIEARALLTPLFIERLAALKEVFRGKRIDAAFFNNRALFAIHTKANMFESYSLFRKAADIRIFERFYDEIKTIDEMIQTLSLY